MEQPDVVQHYEAQGVMPGREAAWDPAVDHVPDGTVSDVVDWVDGDADRARLALAAEAEREAQPRRSLVERLEGVIAQAAASDLGGE